ncbi:MAG: cytochrome c [Leptospiraceae bacterium]|nr:cytochrome c [Leptospiraceae bacterium]
MSETIVADQVRDDKLLKREAAAIWRDRCSQCHGPAGKLRGVKHQSIAPRQFGTFGMSMGFLFGGDKMRAGIYRRIRDGSIQNGRELMPAFGPELAREQIWALVYHIERF